MLALTNDHWQFLSSYHSILRLSTISHLITEAARLGRCNIVQRLHSLLLESFQVFLSLLQSALKSGNGLRGPYCVHRTGVVLVVQVAAIIDQLNLALLNFLLLRVNFRSVL